MPSMETRRIAPRPVLWLNTLIVALAYLFSRALGLIRDIIISAQFGTNPELDAYRAAFVVIDLIYLVISGGALGSVFISVFGGMLGEGRSEDAWRLASGVFNLACVALVLACVLVVAFAEPLVAFSVASGFDAEQRRLTAQLVQLMVVQPLLLGIGGLAKAALESFDKFTLPALGANLYNLGIICGALLGVWLGIYGLVVGVVLGALLFLLVQLPGLRAVGARYIPGSGVHTPGVMQVGWLLLPRLFGQSAWQINLIAMASFASLLGSGAVAANAYALQLMLLPHGLIALSLGTVLYPVLARLSGQGDLDGVRVQVLAALRRVVFLVLPAAVLLGVLPVPILEALFQRGAFDVRSAELTAAALAAYAPGLLGFAAAEILVRSFYALQDTRTPVLIGIAAVAINLLCGAAAVASGLGLSGLGWAFSIANTYEALALLVLLVIRLGGAPAAFWSALVRMALCAAACALLLVLGLAARTAWLPALQPYNWPTDFLPLLLWLGIVALLAGCAYIGVALVLRLPEAQDIIVRTQRIAARFNRSRR